MRDPLSPPPSARHPDTVFLLSLCLLAGLGQLATGDTPGSVDAEVPGWLATTWNCVLTVGAMATLTGVFWRGTRRDGEMVEAVGRIVFAPPALAYAGVIAVVSPGVTGWLAAAPFLGFAVSSVWRVGQIVSDIGELRHVLAVMDRAARNADKNGGGDDGRGKDPP